jgi:hypothetical protein
MIPPRLKVLGAGPTNVRLATLFDEFVGELATLFQVVAKVMDVTRAKTSPGGQGELLVDGQESLLDFL